MVVVVVVKVVVVVLVVVLLVVVVLAVVAVLVLVLVLAVVHPNHITQPTHKQANFQGPDATLIAEHNVLRNGFMPRNNITFSNSASEMVGWTMEATKETTSLSLDGRGVRRHPCSVISILRNATVNPRNPRAK